MPLLYRVEMPPGSFGGLAPVYGVEVDPQGMIVRSAPFGPYQEGYEFGLCRSWVEECGGVVTEV